MIQFSLFSNIIRGINKMLTNQIIDQLNNAIQKQGIEKVRYIFNSRALNGISHNVAAKFLHVAIHIGCMPIIHFLLAHKPSLILTDDKGRTPLMLAVFLSNLDVVEALIYEGADVNATSNITSHVQSVKNYAPIHVADIRAKFLTTS